MAKILKIDKNYKPTDSQSSINSKYKKCKESYAIAQDYWNINSKHKISKYPEKSKYRT